MYKQYFVYILSNYTNTVLYVGVSNDLERRVYEHKTKLIDGFTKRYNINKLVWFEEHNSIFEAIEREKLIKRWKRKWKDELIDAENPEWKDLSEDWYDSIDLDPASSAG